MCRYELSVCPYPHRDSVANLIYNTNRHVEWRLCDLPQPWGKLSCGDLTIIHASRGNTYKCDWCTLALLASTSKFKTTQEQHKKDLKIIEKATENNAMVAALQADIAVKEAELEGLRRIAWEKRTGLADRPNGA